MSLHLNNNNLFLRQNILKNTQRYNAESIQEKEDNKEKENKNSLEVVNSQEIVEEDKLDLVITASADIIMENINKALIINKPNAALNPKIDIVSADSGKPVIDISCRVIDENLNSGDEKKDLFTDLLKQMFGENNTIDAKYLSDNLNNWNEGGDAEIKDFMTIIKNVMDKMGFKYHYDNSPFDEFNENFRFDFQEFFEAMIKTINDEVGVENAKPPVLSQETLKRFNQGDILNEINDLLNSDEFKKNYYLDIDGVIDDYGQGNNNNCVYLATLSALSSSEQGRQAINDAIKDNGDGTYNVTFKPYDDFKGLSVTITYDEIINAKTSDQYSRGDKDVLLFEIAKDKAYDTGITFDLMRALTGYDEINLSNYSIKQKLEYSYESFQKGTTALTFYVPNGVSVKDINNSDVYFTNGHDFAIVDVYIDKENSLKNTVTIVNPWFGDETITLSWEEFSKTNANIELFSNNDAINIDYMFSLYSNGVKTEGEFAYDIFGLSKILSDDQKICIIDKIFENLGIKSLSIFYTMIYTYNIFDNAQIDYIIDKASEEYNADFNIFNEYKK